MTGFWFQVSGFWFPLVRLETRNLKPETRNLLYVLFWRMGSREIGQLRMQVVHGLTAIAFVVVVARLLWHRRKMRKGFY